MATCERCNNLLPRTVDQCPVCGLLIAVASEGRREFEAPSGPGWASGGSATPAGHDVDPFSQAPVWGTTAEQTPASDSGFSLDALSSSSKSTAPPFNADSTVPQPGSPITAEEPIAEYRPPASLESTFGAAGYADHNTPKSSPAELGGLQQPSSQPVPEPGGSPDPTTVEPNLSYLVDREPLTAALAPQRLGHNGSRPGSGVDPIASTPVEALSDDQSTRTVQAFSSWIEGDIKYGRSPRHNLITASLLALGITAFGIGAGAGVIAASASDTLQSFEPEQLVLPEADIDLEAFHDAHGQNVVQLELLDCGVRKTVSGVASDATTVLVPWSLVRTDTTPIVRTSAGERIPARVIGSDARSGLAIVKLSQALEAGGFGWSGANQATSGTELILLHPNGRAGSSRAIVSLGTERNNEGIPGAILVGDEPLEPYSFAITETGRLIGAVSPSGSTLTTADVLRTVTGSFKVNPDNPSSVCPPPPEPEEGEADADG